MSDQSNYLSSIKKEFEYYKMLGDKTMSRISDEGLFWQYNEESNSIAIIVAHLHGNMLSRWTDFLTTDGEKEWRDRDGEFENHIDTREVLMDRWERGWACLFAALDGISEEQLGQITYIRNMGQTVTEAINRQMTHYAYHVGQIVYIGKMVSAASWQSLTIPKGNSKKYNDRKFSEPLRIEHFTDGVLKKND